MDILDAAGNLIGVTERDGGKPDLLIVDGKQVTESELRQDKELFDSFNNDIKASTIELQDDE